MYVNRLMHGSKFAFYYTYQNVYMKIQHYCSLLVASLLATACTYNTTLIENIEIITPDQSVNALKEGNKRFVGDHPTKYHKDLSQALVLKEGQHPHSVVIACSDSRVPVELLFDQGFGDIFVVRTAGNAVVGNMVQGSVDYAVNHLGVKSIVVLGHTSCGAITGVVSSGKNAHDAHGHGDDGAVPAMIERLGKEIPSYKGKSDCLNEAIKANVMVQANKLAKLPHIKEKVAQGKLSVVPAIYDLCDGKVYFLTEK